MTLTSENSPEHGRLIRKLESISRLDPADRKALGALPLRTRSVEAGVEVIAQGSSPTEACFVIEGWLCRYALTIDGGRQIVSFHIPGDLPDRDSVHMPHLDHAIGSVSAARVAFIPHADLIALTQTHTNIALAMWRDSVVDAGVFRQWLTGLGRRTARQRVAHLICEMATRLELLGLSDGDHFAFPVNQAQLADALGLSAVHVNRMVQDLRIEGLITWKASVMTIHDPAHLRAVAGFDPAYLDLKPMVRPH
ncbi:Crp/Fnr family transcriptional regulator [Phenylobacterium sp.]|jgi:CRP-like cAMP-binding protein|uniref:Crp/Fnr family transcriptional regulator n=1 Tax=Phenylobacterium sp. TaxID=1871053 RepID=UPI002F928F27